MNVTLLLKKTTIVFFILCFVISLSFVEAERTTRLQRPKKQALGPKHISSLSGGPGHGVYARKYGYGRPVVNYSTKVNPSKNRRNFHRRRRNGKTGARTYASEYGYKNFGSGSKHNPRIDLGKKPYQSKRREPYPVIKEPQFGSNKQKRRIRPQRLNALQRPLPPKKQTEFDEEDYYFPEEATRAEIKYEHESTRYSRPKKKRRNPGDSEKIKKPDVFSKIPYYDEKPVYKPKKRDPPVSYSTFIQHPSASEDEPEEYYGEADDLQYIQPIVKTKKKRVKKKSNNSRKKIKDEERYKPYVFEKEHKTESYPPIYADEYELPLKTKGSQIVPTFDVSQNDDFVPHKTISFPKPKPQTVFSSATSDSIDHSEYSRPTIQETSHFRPSYSQSWSNPVETTPRPVVQFPTQTEKGFQPQQYVPSQYNYQNRDYASVQKTKTSTTNTQQTTYYSQPDNSYKTVGYNNNYVSSHVSTSNSNAQTPSNYNYNLYSNTVYSNPVQQSPNTYQQQQQQQSISPSPSYHNDVTIQKSVPVYDNTETFYNFNNNAFVNSQSSRYRDSGNTKYGSRVSDPDSVYRVVSGSNTKTDSDSDFIKKHQNLYNNGFSGIPIQGDGYAKENRDSKKDYDIGYGDFQFDENPGS